MSKNRKPGKRTFIEAFSDSEDESLPSFPSQTSTPNSLPGTPQHISGSLSLGRPQSSDNNNIYTTPDRGPRIASSSSGSLTIGHHPHNSKSVHFISPNLNSKTAIFAIFPNAQWEPIEEHQANTPEWTPPSFDYFDEIIGSYDEDSDYESPAEDSSINIEPLGNTAVRVELIINGLPTTDENILNFQDSHFASTIRHHLKQGFQGTFYTSKLIYDEETESFETIITYLTLDSNGNLVKFTNEEEVEDYSDMPALEEATDAPSEDNDDMPALEEATDAPSEDNDDMPALEPVGDNIKNAAEVNLSKSLLADFESEFSEEYDDTTSASETSSEDGLKTLPLDSTNLPGVVPNEISEL